MLQSGWLSKQSVSSRELAKIKPHLQQIRNENSTRALQSLQQIMAFYLGTPDAHGVLHRFGSDFANYDPVEWALQLDKLLQHIAPDSPAFAQLLRRSKDSNAQIIIPSEYMPHHIEAGSYDKTRLTTVRITHAGLAVPPLDGFFMMLAYAIYHSDSIFPPTTQHDHLVLDDYYTSLGRNALLILLRKNLQYFSLREKAVIQKIVYMLRVYLVDELLIKLELDRSKSDFASDTSRIFNTSQDSQVTGSIRKAISLKYRLKPHHMHAIYLLLKYTPEYMSPDFPRYCQAVVEYFPLLRPDQLCLQTLIRLWIYGMCLRNEDNIENEVIRTLESKANSKQGFFYLKRYSPRSIYISGPLSVSNAQTALGIIKLLEKESLWMANPSYLFTFACFFRLLSESKVFSQEFANTRRTLANENRESSLVEKIFRALVIRYNQNLVDMLSKIRKKTPAQYPECHKIVENYQKIIEQYFGEYFKSKSSTALGGRSPSDRDRQIPNEFRFKQVREADLTTVEENANIISSDAIDRVSSESKRNLVTFYRKQPKSCWEVPIQYNESSILYYLWYFVARVAELLLPGRRDHPRLNIRFLANPVNLLGFLAILAVIFLLFR